MPPPAVRSYSPREEPRPTAQKIELDACTDLTGSIRIRLPDAPAHHPVHVVVEWSEPASGPSTGWPPGWFEALGTIDDPTFVRPEQGTYERRDRGNRH